MQKKVFSVDVEDQLTIQRFLDTRTDWTVYHPNHPEYAVSYNIQMEMKNGKMINFDFSLKKNESNIFIMTDFGHYSSLKAYIFIKELFGNKRLWNEDLPLDITNEE